jgi:hypothetical protein
MFKSIQQSTHVKTDYLLGISSSRVNRKPVSANGWYLFYAAASRSVQNSVKF